MPLSQLRNFSVPTADRNTNGNCITIGSLDGGAEKEKTLVLALEQGKVKQSTEGLLNTFDEDKSWLEEMYIQVKSNKLNEAHTEEIETVSPMKDLQEEEVWLDDMMLKILPEGL